MKEQFGELKFDHNGIPNTIQNGKQMLNMFNDKMNNFPQSNFDPNSNGKYNVTNDTLDKIPLVYVVLSLGALYLQFNK